MENLDNTSHGKDGAGARNVGASAPCGAGAGTSSIRAFNNPSSSSPKPSSLSNHPHHPLVALQLQHPPPQQPTTVGGDFLSPTTLCTFLVYASYHLTGTAASAGGRQTAYVVPQGWSCHARLKTDTLGKSDEEDRPKDHISRPLASCSFP